MVRIVTDSSADFEPEELECLDITCVPLSVFFGEQEFQENINLSKTQFYEKLIGGGAFPHTSQPSPQSYIDVMEGPIEQGEEMVVLTLSSGLSGTYQCAVMAKNLLEYEKCYVVDSKTATGGLRILAEHAVKLRDAGKCAEEIVAELEELRSRIVLYACMDTLEYLYKGGRISRAIYTVGALASVKPIIHVSARGEVEIPAKVVGTRKGMRFLCDRMSETIADAEYPVYVMYTYTRENGGRLADTLRKQNCTIPENHIINVGAAIGTHIGPNAFGIVYVSKKKGYTEDEDKKNICTVDSIS